jgi:hypothetical protein
MIENHDLFIHPKDENQKIWRYLDFTKFVDLLNSESLYFSRSDKFEDLFEGSFTQKTISIRERQYQAMIDKKELLPKYTPDYVSAESKKHREEFAINCWHMNDHESAAMWKIYLKSNEGIAIQSTFKKLKNSLHKSDYEMFTGVVNYIDYEKDFIDYGNVLSAYLYKRKSFTHENELRFIIWKPFLKNKRNKDFADYGMKIKIDLKDVVENIYVSPDSPKWLTELIKDTCMKFDFKFNVINSRLNDKPLF